MPFASGSARRVGVGWLSAFDPSDKPNDLCFKVERYQFTPRQIIVYLRGLEPAKTLELKYTFKATVPATLTVPAARA